MATLIAKTLVTLIGVGEVWFFAWLLNPNIDSGFVSLLGLLYGGIQSAHIKDVG